MQITLETSPLEKLQADAVVVVALEGQKHPLIDAAMPELYASGEISGKPLEMALLHRVAGIAAARVLIVGGGKPEKFGAADVRRIAGAAMRYLKGKGVKHAAMVVEGGADHVQAAVEGALLGAYEPDEHKTDRKPEKDIERFSVVSSAPDAAAAVNRGRIVGESQNFARDLVNQPANLLTPLVLAAKAQSMAIEQGLECEILDQDRMKQLGMGALLGVAQGSAEPPALIILRYKPAQATGSDHLAIVGKGVTFDTGGVSIKPSEGMEKMKYDMGGGAAAIGAMRALAQLKPAIPVTAFIPAVENMVGSRAQRPGDIVKTLSGKTVEVLNTDAEGRLILADAITYANRLGCTHMVDAATLTGSIVVALGHIHIGAFTNNDAMLARVSKAAQAAGEKMWNMPMDEEYKDYLKSAFADLPNIGGRWGGSITAAMFLKEFADPTPWVHLDIAGTAWLDEGKPYQAKGPVGVPVRTFVELAMGW